jgi:16S rRNA (guanine527-N7)-methyltransferase
MPANEIPPTTWERWTHYIEETFGFRLDDAAAEHFRTYLDELEFWNANINLVSVRSSEEILWRHFADSLSGAKIISEGRATKPAVIDLGTGAGFPGLAIKIALPHIELTLVESITKKCAFLEHMTERLALGGVRIYNERAENLGQETAHRGRYDFVLSRAVSKFSPNLEIALPLLKAGGKALIYKTAKFADDPAEMQGAARPLKILGGSLSGRFCYRLPTEEQNYCVLQFDKTGPTPKQYPRQPGTPEKKPL